MRTKSIVPVVLLAALAAVVSLAGGRELRSAEGGAKKIVFIAGVQSHGYAAHEHYAGCLLLAKSIQAAMPDYKCVVVRNGYPKDETVFEGADAVICYADGGGGHPFNSHLPEIDALAEKGVGIGCIHYAVETTKGETGEHFLKWIGGYFEPNWSVNPHWTAKFTTFPKHPVTSGVQPFEINDEWYYHMRFRPEMAGVTPILTDLPGAETLNRPDGAHSGNPDVRAAVINRKEPQHVMWVSEREGQRGFGFTGGHDHWNWGDPNFRKLALNACVWIAHGDVPAGGVSDKPLSLEQLEENQDKPQPANFNRDSIRSKLKLPAAAAASGSAKESVTAVKPAFQSPVVTPSTKDHAVEIDVDITGAKELYLVVTDGGNGFGCDWADWAEPRLVGPAGDKKLTELKWKSATSDFGSPQVDKNCNGQPLKIAGKEVANGIGTHANSVIAFDLPPGFVRFKARGGLDNGGTGQEACGQGSSVQFAVFTQKPAALFLAKASGGGGAPASHDAGDAISQLTVHPDLQASLFAAEPMMFNPTSIDIDHLGRVWVCEVLNYRKFANKESPERAEGDRILILEDTNGDGAADKASTFYQGRDIDSAHGICVLPTPSGKGTRAIVSAKDSVFFLTDDDGDLKSDRKELLFTGISGTDHDHGIHAAMFGPDGKLYFNFGNSGKQVKDAAGKPIVDLSGKEVRDNRQPYQEGMVFRCNLDGSQFETLGWNFRNNWEVSVDSFGTLWQSDNDDDGNKGVRINFVMEFGNYGYRDEITGAAWNQQRTGWEDEIPKRHWHLNDPGVVPNLLQTGAGSPTGICIYEGNLLPEIFRGQIIHCDAGPNIVRAYPVKNDGAGYSAEIANILDGATNKWFRPSDVNVAPDGSLLAADWYDPGVGGHRMQDVEHGRIFRLVPKGHDGKYTAPKHDFSTAEGAVAALQSPNLATRYIAWTALHAMGAKAEPALLTLWKSDNPRLRARALWLLGKIEGRDFVREAIADKDSDIRITGVRLARQLNPDATAVVKALIADPSPQVRRELAIALRGSKSPDAADLWAQLAAQHDGKDRWYLEALGIGADGNWDSYFAAWQKRVGDDWNSAAGRDIVWRSRAKQTPDLLAQIIKNPATPPESQPRYLRAFDFLKGPEKDAALKSILGL